METVIYAPIFSNRRVALASQFAMKYMTMVSLLAWRATCPKVPLPGATLSFPVVLALSHILHDPSICNRTLELATHNRVPLETFVQHIARPLLLSRHVVSVVQKTPLPPFPTLRHIARIVEVRLASGLAIHVYASVTPAACDVVSGQWTTVLMNYVSERSFGCAYPRLTLRYRGLLCDGRFGPMRAEDRAAHDHLRARGVEFVLHSEAWPGPVYSMGPYSESPSPFLGPPTATASGGGQGCGKTMHICPLQGRYFGDAGSLVVFYDGFLVSLAVLRDESVPPYGPMVAWRIPMTHECEGRCAVDESVLPAYVICEIVQLMDETRYILDVLARRDPVLRPTLAVGTIDLSSRAVTTASSSRVVARRLSI
ncbi:hypothetical protein GSI_01444 [Ganoderma sinense ZZ0214-1]|uniref:Uncharacterized protein n=1 Tax=Ganoderma sinense ZZ0214-1 TaxID=1077348 RepID=A0A2G8SVG9_9APHY|nr:hypothetical protein GSI_01444 [Ganoderma sinense ZZ0214-1]